MNFTEIKLGLDAASPSPSSRRTFLGQTAAAVTAGIMGSAAFGAEIAQAQELETQSAGVPLAGHKRQKQAYRIRVEAARRERDRPLADHGANGDEQLYPNKIASYSKGFGTLGAPYIASILCAVARPALKAVWYQK